MIALCAGLAACGSADGSAAAELATLPTAEELVEQFGVAPAELDDIGFVAAEEDWSLEEALSRLAWQQGFSTFVQELREIYPEDFAAGGILGDEGARSVFLDFRGPMPEDVRTDPRSNHLDVEFRQATGFSKAELVDPVIDVHYTMRELGFSEVVTGPEIDTGEVRVDTARRPVDRGKSDDEIIAAFPANLQADNVVIVFHSKRTVLGELE